MVVIMAVPFISIIIVTKNRPNDLKKTLKCTTEKKFLGYNSYEIIIVDSSSQEIVNQVKNLVEAAGASTSIPLTYLHKAVNMPAARNIGIQHARGDIVLFIDDDLILQKMALSRIVNDFQQFNEAGAIGGIVIEETFKKSLFGTYGKPGIRINPLGLITINLVGGDKIVEVTSVRGCCMSFQKRVLIEVGGFDETYGGTSHCEESDIQARIKGHGYKILYDPCIVSVHVLSNTSRPKNLVSITSVYENFTYFWFKNYVFSKPSYTICAVPFMICLLLKGILNALVNKNSSVIPCSIKGLLRGISKYKRMNLKTTTVKVVAK
jgi:glycosyltransferase involved in cell wall biosynthesis